MTWVAGVDGCRAGWFVVLVDCVEGVPRAREYVQCASFWEVLALREERRLKAIAVDIPIGLLDKPQPGGRTCDMLARQRLPGRSCVVFSPPIRSQLYAPTFPAAKALGPLTRQCFGICPKIREVDESMSPELQDFVFEVHPEVTFACLNDGKPVADKKKSSAGIAARLSLLREPFGDLSPVLANCAGNGVGRDDILDAYAAAWTAMRISAGNAEWFPLNPPRDTHRLRMEMWY